MTALPATPVSAVTPTPAAIPQDKAGWVLELEAWLQAHPWGGAGATLGFLLGLSLVAWVLTWLVAMPLLRRLIKRTRFEWDDAFLDAKTFRWLGYIPPAVVFALATEIKDSSLLTSRIALPDSVVALDAVQDLAQAFIVLCMMMAINASLDAVDAIYRRRDDARSRPIKGYLQLVKIFVSVISLVCACAIVLGNDPWEFLKYVAGMTAVLLFVFKDTILSLIASIQLTATSDKMLQVGDWIEVPSCGADGDVIDIALHTVKVQNFDKTIVTVPTRNLVDGAFKNWRGMQESGGRRIKRDLHIDMGSIRFLTPEDIERFGRIALLADYVASKKAALAESNKDRGDEEPINSRRLTNIGTFRAYVAAYLRSLPGVHGKFTFLVRQLQPGPTGLPLQIYIFTSTTAWVEYEEIQADIFDHLLAVLPEFGLQAYQQPAGHHVAALRERLDAR